MIFKAIEWEDTSGIPEHTHEEIPQEELWEDGELNNAEVNEKYCIIQCNKVIGFL